MSPVPSYTSRFPLQPGWALKRVLAAGYNKAKFYADLKAGVTVGIVAIPLAMALGVASGMTPQAGLYTAIIPAILAALLGGSKFQVSGPTAAFVALLVPVVSQFGPSGLMVAGLLAGLILILMSILHLAEAIQYIPHPVTTGFTSGIAVVIGVVQIKDFFGLEYAGNPVNFWERLVAIQHALPTVKPTEVIVGLSTLLALHFSARVIKKIPAPVVALLLVTVIVYFVQKIFPEISILTIEKKFSYLLNGQLEKGIPSSMPGFVLPWKAQIAGAAEYKLTWANIVSILPYAFSIALLGAIESLVTAVVADGATGKRHNPNTELFAQGVANVVSPFFGGFASTGAMSRTMTGIRFGSVSPFTAVIHSLTVLSAILFFSWFIDKVPMATLAAILIFVALNMFDKKHFMNILTTAPKDDRIVLAVCFLLTIFADMTVGIGIGTGLAALLFIRRVANIAHTDLISATSVEDSYSQELPKGVFIYRVSGPLFFGAAQKALSTLQGLALPNLKKIIIDLSAVELIDSTAVVAFDSLLRSYLASGVEVDLVTDNFSVLEALRGLQLNDDLRARLKIVRDVKTSLKQMKVEKNKNESLAPR